MAVSADDIKYYKSLQQDGGGIDTGSEIVSGVLNNLINDVKASEAESGVTKYYKLFVKNTNGTDDATGVSVCLANFSAGDDYIRIFPGTADDTTADFDNSKLYGIAKATAELDRSTKEVQVELEKGVDATTVFAANDTITFVSASDGNRLARATVASVSATSITVNEDIPSDIVLDGSYIANTLDIGTLAAAGEYAVWIQQIVPQYAQSMDDPADSFTLTTYFDG